MLTITEVWRPFEIVAVDATPIPETDLVNLQVALDRVPDESWVLLFNAAIARRRRSDRATPSFLGRMICSQPLSRHCDADIATIQDALLEANARYEQDALVIHHARTADGHRMASLAGLAGMAALGGRTSGGPARQDEPVGDVRRERLNAG